MPSGSPGPYQSRLFNFINRQSIRLTDRWDRAVRNLKVAAVWGAQILLYPVYLLVQASLSAGRQLSSAAEAGWPQLKEFTHKEPQETPPTSDTPIQQVLGEVSTLELQVERLKVESSPDNLPYSTLEESLWGMRTSTLRVLLPYPLGTPARKGNPDGERSKENELSSRVQPSNLQPLTQTDLSQTTPESSEERWLIQGVASLLESRTLVLVTVQNEILDILTPEQQQKLSSKISWEVANLMRQRRLAQESDPKQANLRLTTLNQPRVFPPVRLFWKIMGWVQNSPVAIAANLFQESTLVCRDAKSPSQIQPRPQTPRALANREIVPAIQHQRRTASDPVITPQLLPKGALAFLDRTVAELESHQLVPGTEVVIALSDRAKRALKEGTQKLLQPLQTQFMTPGAPDASPEASGTNTFQIQALIYAAIDHFFGRRGSNLPGAASQEQSAIRANPQGETHQLSGSHSTALPPDSEFADAGEPDPWLTWGDLFGSSDAPGKAQTSKVHIPNQKSQPLLPEAFNSKTSVKAENSIWGVIKRHLSLNQSPGKLSAPSAGEPMVEPSESVLQTGKLSVGTEAVTLQTQSRQKGTTPTKHQTLSSAVVSSHSTSVSPAKPVTTAITTPSSPSSDTDLEPAHDWIETPATPSGYVKHPLERLLEYVDLGILWLEEVVVKVWRWVHQLGRRG